VNWSFQRKSISCLYLLIIFPSVFHCSSQSFGCVLHLCRGTPNHDFCAVNKQLYRGDSHPLAPSFNTLLLCCFSIMWVFPCQYYSISAPYSLFHQLSVLYNLINWQRCWITHLKNYNPTMPHTALTCACKKYKMWVQKSSRLIIVSFDSTV